MATRTVSNIKHFAARGPASGLACAVLLAAALAFPDRAHAQLAETSTTATATAAATAVEGAPVEEQVEETAAEAEPAEADESGEEPGDQPKKKRRVKVRKKVPVNQNVYRNPQGSAYGGLILGGAIGSGGGSYFQFGLSIGYAVFTGIVPGARALFFASDDGVGGQLAGTLTLTPPVSWDITPFALGLAGSHWEPKGSQYAGQAWFYGAGGGLYLGDPFSRAAFRVGWVWTQYRFDEATINANGPLIEISFRL